MWQNSITSLDGAGQAQLTLEPGQAQLTLGRKMASTFASSKNIIHQLPNNKN